MTAINAPGLPDALPSILTGAAGTAAAETPEAAPPAVATSTTTPNDDLEAGR